MSMHIHVHVASPISPSNIYTLQATHESLIGQGCRQLFRAEHPHV